MYALKNKPQNKQTASPDKYPQKKFKDKSCRCCGEKFSPKAPSHLYCSQTCADVGVATAYLKRTYGITMEDYNRMFDEQEGLCCVCDKPGWTMADHHKLTLVVDHCHASGDVRGLLCHNCNRALGLLKDSTENLQRAIQYLGRCNDYPKGVGSSEPKRPAPTK